MTHLRSIIIGLMVSAGGIVGGFGLRVWWEMFLWLAETLA